MDAFGKLVVLLYKFSPEGPASTNGTKLNLLNKVLDTVVRVLVKNCETKRTKFNQRPFYRLFASLLVDLLALTPEADPAHLQVRYRAEAAAPETGLTLVGAGSDGI